MRRKLIQGVLIGLASASAALVLHFLSALDWLEANSWDIRMRAMKQPSVATDSIRLVFIDEYSITWARQEKGVSWPWPREMYVPIVTFCREAGAKGLVFDMTFSDPSSLGVEDDVLFGSALASVPGSVIGMQLSNDQMLGTNTSATASIFPVEASGLSDFLSEPGNAGRVVMKHAAYPVPEVATNAGMLATVNASPDPDAIIRRTLPFQAINGQFVPSLGLAAYLAANPGTTVSIENQTLRVGSRSIPMDASANAILNYRGESQTHRTFNAAAIIESGIRLMEGKPPQIPLSEFEGKYVFVGATASGLMDLRPTPISRIYPGTEVHATFLDNLLAGDFVRQTPVMVLLVATVLAATLAGILSSACSSGWQSAVLPLLLLPAAIAPGFIAYRQSLWLNVTAPTLSVLLAWIASTIVNYMREGRQKRFIKAAFRQYLSPHVIDQLIANPAQLKLGGEARDLTIFFSDVQGFTGLSESLQPEALTTLLNDYLTEMTDIILAQGGTVDKYEGDAIIAFWNAPVAQPDHALRGVRAALLCQEKLAEMRPLLRERAGRDLFARIGMNSGRVVVGNMGSHQRFDYTFLGDAGNLASRLEGTNKKFGTFIIISEATKAQLTDEIAVREISRIRVVGRKDPVRIFEPMFRAEFEKRTDFVNRFASALQAYYDGAFTKAADMFAPLAGEDKTSQIYEVQCRELAARPPEKWEGIWEMTEK